MVRCVCLVGVGLEMVGVFGEGLFERMMGGVC